MPFALDRWPALRSLRALRKRPGFTAAVVGMLAVGIGATTAMFSVVNGVLLAPLPYANEQRLVSIVNHGARPGDVISMPDWCTTARFMQLVLAQCVRLAALGAAIGLAVAFAASSALRSLLYGIGATDFWTYAGGCAVLLIAILAASWFPARSASRTDPAVVMRAE